MRITVKEIESRLRLDHSRDSLLTFFGKKTLQDRYCLEGESFQHVFGRAALAFSAGDDTLAQRLYDYASKQWLSFATPLISNGGSGRGQNISCFLNYVDDSIDGLVNNFAENAYLSTSGGGIGSYWGSVRSVGEKTVNGVETPGLMPFMHTVDAQMIAYHQGSTRRGSAATYIDISHPEIIAFIEMRATGGGDIHRKNLNLHHGISITDDFMWAVIQDKPWNLVDPKSKKVKETVSARQLFIKILMTRVKTGEPYLFWRDTANKHLPEALKRLGLEIFHSNLCTEITLPTNKDRTAVCCLSSLNYAKMDEWWAVRELFISDVLTMLDNALQTFIDNAPATMWRAVASAKGERSIGLGALGFHTYIQSKGLPFGSDKCREINRATFAEFHRIGLATSRRLAAERGEAPDMKGTGLRWAHIFAIAPNASSSIICGGVSPSIEPLVANAFTQKTLSGSHLVKNPALVPVLEAYGRNDDETWASIVVNSGSVQHLDFLTLYEKEVFKTAIELDQEKLVILAAERQPFICQAQSLNLFFPANVSAAILMRVHILAWKMGLKSLYYLRSEAVRKTETVSKAVERRVRADAPAQNSIDPAAESSCLACEA